jgi:hypothetical protein
MLFQGFFHELGHLSACLVTRPCYIESVIVSPLQEKLERYVGGNACLIASFGNVYPLLLSVPLIICSYSVHASKGMSLFIDVILFVCIWVGGEWWARVGAVLMMAFMAGMFFWSGGRGLTTTLFVMGYVSIGHLIIIITN